MTSLMTLIRLAYWTKNSKECAVVIIVLQNSDY